MECGRCGLVSDDRSDAAGAVMMQCGGATQCPTYRQFVALLLALAPGLICSVAGAVTLERVALRVSEGRGRLVLETDAETGYRLRMLSAPATLIVDLQAAPGSFLVLPPASGLFRELRVETTEQGSSVLRVLLTQPSRIARDFRVQPDQAGGHRIVIDISPVGPPPVPAPKAAATPGPAAPAATVPLASQPAPGAWKVRGSLSARAEDYGNDGDPDSAIYFAEGGQHYGEFNLNAERQASPFDRTQFRTNGLYNQSEYRSTEQDAVLEQMALRWDKGDTALPFSLQAGDYFGYLSRRTLQLGLKGMQLELQPGGRADRRHSFLLFAGDPASTYNELRSDGSLFSGASWLLSDRDRGLLGVNLVNNRDRQQLNADGSDRVQDVASVVGATEFPVATQRFSLEGEIAGLEGDGNGFQDESGLGFFTQLTGRSSASPLNYSARFEQYDEHFAPAGAVVTRDRRSLETRGSWQFGLGPQLRLRALGFRDGYESDDPLDTVTYGANLVGPLQLGGKRLLNFDADLFTQTVNNRSDNIDTLTRTARLDLSAPLGGQWSGRLGLFRQDIDDRTLDPGTTDTRELRLVASRDLQLFGDYGFLAPELVLRTIEGPDSDSDETGPGLTFGFYGAAYSLDGWYYRLEQDRSGAGASDFTTDSVGLLFSTWRGSHFLELEANYDEFGTGGAGDTSGYRVGAQYTWFFAREPRRAARQAAEVGAGPGGDGARGRPVDDLLAVRPGQTLEAAQAELTARGLKPNYRQARMLVFDSPGLLPGLDQRQRYAVLHDGRRVLSTALAMDFDAVGDPVSMARQYADARALFLRRFGPPARAHEAGEFSENLAADLAAGRFLRLIEWHTGAGTLRFGIPRRPDGLVRMELGLAPDYPRSARSNWSLGSLR